MVPSFHGDELNNLESGSIAAQVGARAVSHLEYVIFIDILAFGELDQTNGLKINCGRYFAHDPKHLKTPCASH